jgi:hypothetical protein
LIVKEEQVKGSFEFDSKEVPDPDLKNFSLVEKTDFFRFLSNFGISLSSDGKRSWNDVKEKFYSYNNKYEAKSIISIEKLV